MAKLRKFGGKPFLSELNDIALKYTDGTIRPITQNSKNMGADKNISLTGEKRPCWGR